MPLPRFPELLLAAATAALLVGCGAYTSESRQAEIGAELQTLNGKSYDAALAALLSKRRATVIDVQPETFSAQLEECTASMRDLTKGPAKHDVRLERKNGRAPIAVDCDALREGYVARRGVEAKDAEGKDVLLVPADDAFDGGNFVLAAAGDGKVLLVEPRRHKVDGRTVRVPGNCDRMPMVKSMRPIVRLFVLDGRSAKDLDHVTMEYDTVEIDQKCDTYTD